MSRDFYRLPLLFGAAGVSHTTETHKVAPEFHFHQRRRQRPTILYGIFPFCIRVARVEGLYRVRGSAANACAHAFAHMCACVADAEENIMMSAMCVVSRYLWRRVDLIVKLLVENANRVYER